MPLPRVVPGVQTRGPLWGGFARSGAACGRPSAGDGQARDPGPGFPALPGDLPGPGRRAPGRRRHRAPARSSTAGDTPDHQGFHVKGPAEIGGAFKLLPAKENNFTGSVAPEGHPAPATSRSELAEASRTASPNVRARCPVPQKAKTPNWSSQTTRVCPHRKVWPPRTLAVGLPTGELGRTRQARPGVRRGLVHALGRRRGPGAGCVSRPGVPGNAARDVCRSTDRLTDGRCPLPVSRAPATALVCPEEPRARLTGVGAPSLAPSLRQPGRILGQCLTATRGHCRVRLSPWFRERRRSPRGRIRAGGTCTAGQSVPAESGNARCVGFGNRFPAHHLPRGMAHEPRERKRTLRATPCLPSREPRAMASPR